MTMNSAQPGHTAVQLLDVRKSYPSGQNRVWALRGAFLALAPGSFTAIMGPSGSGKSTLLQCAAGLESPDTGRLTIGDHVISDLSPDALTRFLREHIGFVFQDYNLVGHLDVNANIALPLVLGGEQLDPAWRDHLLGSVGLGGLQSSRPSQLSGGQAQRVAIARALASRPTVVFADEPTGALDSHTAAALPALLGSNLGLLGWRTPAIDLVTYGTLSVLVLVLPVVTMVPVAWWLTRVARPGTAAHPAADGFLSGWVVRGSNPRPPGCKPGALTN